MIKTRLNGILQNFYFSNNTEADKSDIGCKANPLIIHFNESLSRCVSNDATQRIDEHMVKFMK